VQRIHVVGTSGAGKTTFAAQVARRLRLPHLEIDSIFWGPEWRPMPRTVLRERLAEVLARPGWVVDGNYGSAREMIWSRVEVVVGLDFSLPIVLHRVVWRTARRLIRREELWAGNRESLRKTFSRDSILVWSLSTFRRRRREYPALLADRPDIVAVRLRSPRAARHWLESLGE